MTTNNQEFKSQIELALSVALQDPASFEQADKMYRQMFRSEPYPAKELLDRLQEEFDDGEDDEILSPLEMFKSITGYVYDERLMVVELCNYKGEGEGQPVVFDSITSKLPVFVSKEFSFSMF